MNFLSKIPGPFLVFLGACCLSFGGLIIKSFEGSTLWQILFWRQLFFILIVTIFLITTYKKEIFKALYKSGIPGVFGGLVLGFGFSSYVFAMYNTTVANTNFIIQTQVIFLAIFGYLFLNEKITKIAIEISSQLIQKLIGAEANNSSISAIVDDLSKKNRSKYYGN